MGHKQYMRVGQTAKNSLFGVDRRSAPSSNGTPLQMLISQQGKFNHGRLAVIVISLFTLAMGIILSSIPWLDYLILKNLRLWNGTLSYHYWQKPGVVRLTKVYIFNVTNPESFLNSGEKPNLVEIGPFVYREDMEKVNIKFHDNGTVSFQHRKILQFVPELSVNKDLKVMVPNIPLLTLTSKSNSLGYFVQKTLSLGLTMSRYKPFRPLTAEQLVFGYDDGLVKLAHTFYPKHIRPMSKMGLLVARNGTLNEVSTIYTGHTGMDKFGLLDKLNGLDRLPYWDTAPCNAIAASEGSFFPPRDFTNSDIVHIYDKDLCRILPLEYRGPVSKDGLNADLYTPPENVFETAEVNPDNKCFCSYKEECAPRGLQNIAPCQYDAPVYLSFPHFYKADDTLLEPFVGLKPNKELHETYFKIQSKLGVPIEGKVRVQMNLKVEKAEHVASVAKFPSIMFPIMWLEEGIDELTPPIRRWIYLATVFAENAVPIFTYGLIIFGALTLVFVFIRAYKNVVFTQETIEMGKRTIRRGSSFIVNGQHRLMIVRDSYSLLSHVSPEETQSLC
ncbi:scavenger receptor class B member 1 isoform X2 [Chrysoperla carnea]|nr:scavenger receptor class B member 1 isoform X2 [Chrysoperla carnea]